MKKVYRGDEQMVSGNGYLGLNLLISREALVEKNNLSETDANAVFARVQPLQYAEDGTALYLESIVDRAIEDVLVEKYRPSSRPGAFFSDKENPNMIALDGMSSINRLADLVSTWLERALEEKQQKTPRMLSPEEASTILRIHVQTVTAWCREGKLRAVKNGGNEANGKGGKWLIPREEIDAYLHRQQVIHGKTKGGAK